MKPAYQRSVFISYQWDQKNIAQALQLAFEAKKDQYGRQKYLVIRDDHFLINNTYIKGFMKMITHPKIDYVLPIVSARYLESQNCMYEVDKILKRYDWENNLLPYVVTLDQAADAHIYSDEGVRKHRKHWQELLAHEDDPAQKNVLENIIRTINPFLRAIRARINISEEELVATHYQALFDIVAAHEAKQAALLFGELDYLLQMTKTYECQQQHQEVQSSFITTIDKLNEMRHVDDIYPIAEKIYTAYGEYLLRQGDTEQGQVQLQIAANFRRAAVSTSALEMIADQVPPAVTSQSLPPQPNVIPVSPFAFASSLQAMCSAFETASMNTDNHNHNHNPPPVTFSMPTFPGAPMVSTPSFRQAYKEGIEFGLESLQRWQEAHTEAMRDLHPGRYGK